MSILSGRVAERLTRDQSAPIVASSLRPLVQSLNRFLALATALAACHSLTDPALPATATSFTPPPVYSQWWTMVEQCSGLSGSLAAVSWFVVPGSSVNDGTDSEVSGYWSKASNRIVLANAFRTNGPLVRHEMLHALIQDVGHPASYFQQKCAGVVVCVKSCLTSGSAVVSVSAATAWRDEHARDAAERATTD